MEQVKPQEKFSISYDASSEDLKNHEIDATDLGAAITGMADLINEAVKIISNGSAEAELKVTTPAKKGSVIVDFLLIATNPTTLTVLKYLGIGSISAAPIGATVLELINKLKNQKITKIDIREGSDVATITVDGKEIQCDRHVAQMAANRNIRNSLHKIIQAPLDGKPNAKFKILDQGKNEVISLSEEAIDNFIPQPAGTLEDTYSNEEKVNISFAQVNFESGRGWKARLPNGEERSVTIEDTDFLKKVRENQQEFKKDDLFEVTLVTETIKRPSRSTIICRITKVSRHWVGGKDRLV